MRQPTSSFVVVGHGAYGADVGCRLCSRSVFEFSEEEVDELWASVDLNGDGMVTRPKAALLLKRAVVLQHSKMKMMVQEKLEKEEDIEAGLIRGIPRWMQWCAALSHGKTDKSLQTTRQPS